MLNFVIIQLIVCTIFTLAVVFAWKRMPSALSITISAWVIVMLLLFYTVFLGEYHRKRHRQYQESLQDDAAATEVVPQDPQ